MDAQQCVQLTGTNRSFGLIALVAKAREKRTKRPPHQSKTQFCFNQRSSPAWWPSARRSDPIPSRTRPSNASAPMVLCLKTRESRSSPGLPRTFASSSQRQSFSKGSRQWAIGSRPPNQSRPPAAYCLLPTALDAGWSSPVARQAHNLKAAGSNPAPATKFDQEKPFQSTTINQARRNPGYGTSSYRAPSLRTPPPTTNPPHQNPEFSIPSNSIDWLRQTPTSPKDPNHPDPTRAQL